MNLIRISIPFLILLVIGFASIEHRPIASKPGVLSNITSLKYNLDENHFGFLQHDGFREDKLVKSLSNYNSFITSKRISQQDIFDSLKVGLFTEIQPPSCVHLTDNLFIDEAEITNLNYQEYIFYLNRDSSETVAKNAVPPMKVFDNNYANYFTDPKYRFFPVVGMTYKQAEKYCEWRSSFLTDIYTSKYNNSVKFTFRLPHEVEWELAAANGLDKRKYPYGVENLLMVKYKVNPNAVEFIIDLIASENSSQKIKSDIKSEGILKDLPFNTKRELPYFLTYDIPYYTYSYYRNNFGVYNLIGNVAEMVSKKGVAKGGSFLTNIDSSKITDRMIYNSPRKDLGFRCVCEVE